MDQDKETAPAEQGAPPAAAPAAEQSTPTKSAAETKLKGQLADAKAKGEGYKKERDKAKGERDKAAQERDELRTENGQLKQQLAEKNSATAPETQAAASTDEAPADEHAETKALLKRLGLKQAWVEPNGQIAFDEKHLQHFYGEEGFQSLTVISAE